LIAGLLAVGQDVCEATVACCVILVAVVGASAVLELAAGDHGSHAAVCYDGPISERANRRLLTQLAEGGIDRLVIRSGGAEVKAGIELGREVFSRTWDVEVGDYSAPITCFPRLAGRSSAQVPWLAGTATTGICR
jgi:hypothetical protein